MQMIQLLCVIGVRDQALEYGGCAVAMDGLKRRNSD